MQRSLKAMWRFLSDSLWKEEVEGRDEAGVERQWPLAEWAAGVSGGKTRVRRRDSDLIPLDLEVFRRENTGPKPVWKDPRSPQEFQKRRHDKSDMDEEYT